MEASNPVWLRLLLAFLPPALAFVLQWIFGSTLQPYAWLLFFPAVFVSSWLGGVVSGIAAAFVSTVLVWWSFIPAQYSFHLENAITLVSMGIFSSVGIFFSVSHLQLKRVSQRMEEGRAILHASEASLAVTLRSIGEAVITTDADGRISRLNAVAEQLTGWAKDEAIGRQVAEIFHTINKNTQPPTLNPIAETLAQEESSGLASTSVLLARDGQAHAIVSTCTPITDHEGNVLGEVFVFRDVSQESSAQAALRDSEERYRTLFESMDEGFCVVEMLRDQSGNAFDYRFIEINPMFETQTGLKHALGKTIREMVPDHDTHWFDIYGKVASTGQPIRFENPAIAMQKYYDVFAYRIGGAGSEKVGILFKDIFERIQADRAIIAAKEQAELASRAKGSFLATMSHEIRTPLTGMLGMLELLSLTRLDSEQQATLDAAWESGRGLLRIVSDILDWSKIEEGKLELSLRATSMAQLLQEVVNTYSRVASAKDLVLWQHVDEQLSTAHIVDPLRLSQVLNNFVSNAIKFTPRGEIELHASLLEHSDSGERIRFSVRDTGSGIAKEVQEHLFQRYRQESSDTARMYGGTGLGLAICRRLAEIMDGQIELISEPGRGSTFSITLTLPVAGAPEGIIRNAHPEVKQRVVEPLLDGGMDAPRVLAVDDHPVNRELLARQLELLGFQAETAENGAVALAMWRSGRFALVITDCHMPEMDGYGLARAIREIEAEESLRLRTPIIAWTANALAEEADHCHAAGMDEILVKPVDLMQLKTMLSTCLSIPESESRHSTLRLDVGCEPPADPIDFSVLARVAPERGTQSRLLRDFRNYLCTDYAKLILQIEQGELADLESTAHRMKGSCNMVGAVALATVSAAMEQAARKHDLSELSALGNSLGEAFTRLCEFIDEYRKSNGTEVGAPDDGQ